MSIEVIQVAVVGLIGGVLSGLLGVGGGIVFVPALVVFLGEDQHVAQGVSLGVIVVTASVGSLTHHRLGSIDVAAVRVMAPAAVVSALAGAFVAGLLGTGALRILFGCVGIVLSFQIGYTSLRSLRTGGASRPRGSIDPN